MVRTLTCWVSWIDDDDCTRRTSFLGLCDRPLQLLRVQRPAFLLIQVVADLYTDTADVTLTSISSYGHRSVTQLVLAEQNADECG